VDSLFLSSTRKKQLLTIGTRGVVLEASIGTLLENGLEVRDIEIPKNTVISIDYFDLYTNKVIITCVKDQNPWHCSVQYDFILNNCVVEVVDKNKIVECVYTQEKINNVVDFRIFLYFVTACLIFVLGTLLGKII